MSARLSWSKKPGTGRDGLPPDVTPPTGETCSEQDPWHGFLCTRIPNHGGRHAAGDGFNTLACWWSR